MPDYTKTIIYKLINYDYPELVYVGSTTNFTKRKQNHKDRCLNEKNKKYNLKVYTNIRENDGWENWNMIKICDYPCNNKREAELKEDEYMTELKASLNMIRASRTQKQYQEDNKEKIQEYAKEYRDNNKEKIKEYNETNKEKLKEYNKEYNEKHKEKIKENKKEYYETNKSTILKNMKELVKCECGCEVIKKVLKRHQKTKKHISLMKCI
jgi:DNA anti-recombination protein RmuC